MELEKCVKEKFLTGNQESNVMPGAGCNVGVGD